MRFRRWVVAAGVWGGLGGSASGQITAWPEPIQVGEGIWYLGPGDQDDTLGKHSHNIRSADTINADALWTAGGLGLGLTGSGVVVGLWDSAAVRATHRELAGRVTVVDNVGVGHHATHVAGTLAAVGVDPQARGMASGVTIRSRTFSNDLVELAMDAPVIHISNHSYGFFRGWVLQDRGRGLEDVWYADRSRYDRDPNFGKYDFDARKIDETLHANQHLLSVWSAGNDRSNQFTNRQGDNTYVTWLSKGPFGAGWYRVTATGMYAPPGSDGDYDCLPNGGQTAKNTLVVGAIHAIASDPYAAGDVRMTSFSSWGPTDDGRIGVDLVANGMDVYSSFSNGDDSYGYMRGTSMAAPSVAGAMALLHEHHRNLYGRAPKAATLKGLAIHTAFDAGNPGPDYTFGWGVMDASAAAHLLSDSVSEASGSRIFENTYTGQEWTFSFLADGGRAIKATLVWPDPPGLAQSSGLSSAILNDPTPALVNNLDLWITDEAGTVFHAWSLDPSNPSSPAVRDRLNFRDNVEQVFIESPLAGIYTLHVGHVGASFTQNYSLLISGMMPLPEPHGWMSAMVLMGLFCGFRTRRGMKVGRQTTPSSCRFRQ